MPIEKYSTILPAPGQGLRVMKSKLLTALGATGVLRPFTANPERILERKILLQNAFNPNPAAPIIPVVPSNGLLANLTHYYSGASLNDLVGTSNFTAGASISTNTVNGPISGCFFCNNSGTPGAGQTCTTVTDTMSTPSVANFSGGAGISFSMQLWVYVYNICQTFTEVCTKYNRGVTLPEWDLYETANSVFHFQCENAANNATVTLEFSGVGSNLTLGTWNHLVFGYDDVHQQIFTYLNGGTHQTAAIVGTLTGNTAVELFNAGTSNNEYQGRLAEFGFWWKRVLSQSDVTLLYNGGAGLAFSQFS